MDDQEIARIRVKLKSFPPYDWEDDVDALVNALIEANARADANFRVYALTEKYHNEDMLLMQEMEKVIKAAHRTVSGPDSENYAALAESLDSYEQARKERDRTY